MTGLVTEVRITLKDRPSPAGVAGDRLQAWADFVIADAMVVHQGKIVRRPDGSLMLAFPSSVVAVACDDCGGNLPLTARFCPHCGTPQPRREAHVGKSGRPKIYTDLCHPISREVREAIESAVLAEYRRVVAKASRPVVAA
jgi:stage V sporulation protein G